MSLTYQQIWEQYSQVQFIRRMYIKRLKTDGTYEANFTEISQGLMKDGSVQGLTRSLPNNSWQFGKVTFDNVSLEILSAYQEFASEQDKNSIFFGFLRHYSIIKIVDALIDKYSDPNSQVEASVTAFIGLIDSRTAQTEQGYESITALDFLAILENINVSDLTLTQTTLSALVYEVLNRLEFTKYFNVSNSSAYIEPGYDATDIDITQYTGTVGAMLEDLAKGHSIFYINSDDNYFYFKPIEPTNSVIYSFLESNNRKLSVSAYREGVDRQITAWYWNNTDPVISSVSDPVPAVPIPQNFDISGVTNNSQRQGLLNYLLINTQIPKPYFSLQLPYFPIIKLLDRVVVQSFGSAPVNAARWGMFLWTPEITSNPSISPRWFKPAGIRISKDVNWMVRGISHDAGLTTTLELEKIL